jgi:DNA-binding response OmpR family regulator
LKEPSRILLIDRDDARRATRVHVLEGAGYDVRVRQDWLSSEQINHEGHFDLLIIALRRPDLKQAAEYSDRLSRGKPTLPILLITDAGLFAPRGTISRVMESGGDPGDVLRRIAAMLAGSTHIREVDELLRVEGPGRSGLA